MCAWFLRVFEVALDLSTSTYFTGRYLLLFLSAGATFLCADSAEWIIARPPFVRVPVRSKVQLNLASRGFTSDFPEPDHRLFVLLAFIQD